MLDSFIDTFKKFVEQYAPIQTVKISEKNSEKSLINTRVVMLDCPKRFIVQAMEKFSDGETYKEL